METNLNSIGSELSGSEFRQFQKDAIRCRSFASKIFESRDSMFDAVVRYDKNWATEQEVKNMYNITLDDCSESLKLTTGYIPDSSAVSAREKYASSITDMIDRRLVSYNIGAMAVHMGNVVSSTIDYLMGPITLKLVIDGSLDRAQSQGITTVSSYIVTYEQDRIRRTEDFNRDGLPPIKVFAKGTHLAENHTSPSYNDNSPTRGVKTLIFNLMELVQPTLHLLGKDENSVDEIKARVKENFDTLARKREEFRHSGSKSQEILLEDPEIRKLIVDQIRPTNPFDLLKGHPLTLKLSNVIASKGLLERRRSDLIGSYIEYRGSSSLCCQAMLYDILFDDIYGVDGDQLIPIDILLSEFGGKPLPVFPTQKKYLFDIRFNCQLPVPVLTPQEYVKINPMQYVGMQPIEEPSVNEPPANMFA